MIVSPNPAIRPAQELARLTLETDNIKHGRRSSTLQSQRRPTLGTIESRPIIGPLPQPAIDSDTVQPLQSPEAIDASDSGFHQPAGRQQTQPQVEPAAPKDGNQGEDRPTEAKIAAADSGSENIARDETMQTANESISLKEQHEGTTQQQAQPPNTDETVQSATDDTTEKNKSIEYKPPEGKPPPVPPRPLATATLEHYARQQDVTEVLGHAIFQLSCATRPTGFNKSGEQQDEFHDIFYGEEQRHVLLGTATPQAPVQFLIETLPINNEPKDLYAALDNYFDLEEVGTSEVYVTITKLPPVLCVGLGRVIQDLSGNVYKINNHVELPNTIFMDRYVDAPEDSNLVARRKQTWEYKKELRRLQARIDRLEPKGKEPVDEVLNTALAAMQHLAEVGAAEKLDGLTTEAETINKMMELSHAVEEERKDLRNRILLLDQQIKDSFTDAAFRKHEYKLHAAFFHRGTVGSGHYWIYIFDHVNEIWRKYNDDHVTHVADLREIFANPQDDRSNPNWSAYNPANPYFMLYVRSDCIEPEAGIVETVKRDPVILPTPTVTIHDGPGPAITNNATFPAGMEANLRPLGTDTPENENTDSSHHEFSGQQSQISYMPPAGPPPGKNDQEQQDAQAWQDEEMKLAIERSLQPETAEKKKGDWDDSENMAVGPRQW